MRPYARVLRFLLRPLMLGSILYVFSVYMGGVPAVEARSLSSQVQGLYGQTGVRLTTEGIPNDGIGANIDHSDHFDTESLDIFALTVRQLSASAADFPALSTTPGFTYTYNPALQIFERSSLPLGPIFVEQPYTIGRGKMDFGFSYVYLDFDELDGDNLDGLTVNVPHSDCCPSAGIGGDPARFELDTIGLTFDKFELQSHVMSFFTTYGLTESWDVNILIPLVVTSLDTRVSARINNESGTGEHFFDDSGARGTTAFASADSTKTGVGDILLRTKYHFYKSDQINMASGLTLRLPSGDEDNFQGIGDTTLTPFFAGSASINLLELYTNGGIEINADDLVRSRVRYSVGAAVQLMPQLGAFVSLLGSSNLTSDRISFTSEPNEPIASLAPDAATSRTFSRNLTTSIVDLSVGFKANIYESVIGFAGAIIPLNNDGLRTDVTPTAGLKVSF